MEADAFVKQVVETYNVKHFVVGKNHRFGKQAKGDFALLQQLGPELGYTIDAFETVSDNSQRISSTNIRAALMFFEVNVIANYDPAIIPYLKMPVGTELEREEGTDNFQEIK